MLKSVDTVGPYVVVSASLLHQTHSYTTEILIESRLVSHWIEVVISAASTHQKHAGTSEMQYSDFGKHKGSQSAGSLSLRYGKKERHHAAEHHGPKHAQCRRNTRRNICLCTPLPCSHLQESVSSVYKHSQPNYHHTEPSSQLQT
jgi:hypothetical protein